MTTDIDVTDAEAPEIERGDKFPFLTEEEKGMTQKQLTMLLLNELRAQDLRITHYEMLIRGLAKPENIQKLAGEFLPALMGGGMLGGLLG